MVRVGGLEPPPSAFQMRSSAGLSYTLIELGPTTGFEPASSASVARCSSAELRGEIGAEGWFRANLPASSARCFHQISFLGGIGADTGRSLRLPRGLH